MGRRGNQLTDHILFTAKDVFLELGFERTSMDVIAERAETSKRTLYAHFESKEKLYLAVIELVRGLYLDKLKSPADYAEETGEALVQFCGRFLELLLWAPSIHMCRLTIAEAERFPEGSSSLYDAVFVTAQQRLASYLRERLRSTPEVANEASDDLLGQVLYPRFPRALFGIDKPSGRPVDEKHLNQNFDLRPIRKRVADLLRK